jgi:hypothetical protein
MNGRLREWRRFRGGTVNGRTLAQVREQRERWRAMERADWKRRMGRRESRR